MRSHNASLADVLEIAKAVRNGMNDNETEMKSIILDLAALAALVDKFLIKNRVQEKLKGDLHEASDELYATMKVLKDQLSRIVSLLEGKYGKTSPPSRPLRRSALSRISPLTVTRRNS